MDITVVEPEQTENRESIQAPQDGAKAGGI